MAQAERVQRAWLRLRGRNLLLQALARTGRLISDDIAVFWRAYVVRAAVLIALDRQEHAAQSRSAAERIVWELVETVPDAVLWQECIDAALAELRQ